MHLEKQSVVVVGGSSGIGLATATAAAKLGAEVTVASRSARKLEAAAKDMGPGVKTRILDIMREEDVAGFFSELGPVDHVAVTASHVRTGLVREQPLAEARAAMDSKYWGAYHVARSCQVRPGGSLTLVSGLLSRRPHAGMAGLAAINAALEALGRGLALELAPVRVNVVSPGIVDTPLYEDMPAEARRILLTEMGGRLPVGRAGRAEEIAQAILLCMTNGFLTGSVLDVDGGGLLV